LDGERMVTQRINQCSLGCYLNVMFAHGGINSECSSK
jgi:hypothetical protein